MQLSALFVSGGVNSSSEAIKASLGLNGNSFLLLLLEADDVDAMKTIGNRKDSFCFEIVISGGKLLLFET